MLAKGGSEDDSRRSVRSGEGRMQICGLKDDGRTGAILSRFQITCKRDCEKM
jgi:hypothetical protein